MGRFWKWKVWEWEGWKGADSGQPQLFPAWPRVSSRDSCPPGKWAEIRHCRRAQSPWAQQGEHGASQQWESLGNSSRARAGAGSELQGCLGRGSGMGAGLGRAVPKLSPSCDRQGQLGRDRLAGDSSGDSSRAGDSSGHGQGGVALSQHPEWTQIHFSHTPSQWSSGSRQRLDGDTSGLIWVKMR